MPPYVLTPDEQRHLAEGLLSVLDQVLAEIDALPPASERAHPMA